MSLALVLALLASAPDSSATALAEPPAEGRRSFEGRCARCHGGDGNGGELGPEIVSRLPSRTDDDLERLVREGIPSAGMPGFALAEAELRALVAHLRTLRSPENEPPARRSVTTTDGREVQGLALGKSDDELQLLGDDRRIHLFRREGERYRSVTSDAEWPTYNGVPGGNRFSRLDQIHTGNVGRLAPRWIFAIEGTGRLQTTPVVVDGVMYVTAGNQVHALDAGSGRPLWYYRRTRTKGQAGDAGVGINRGVAVAGERVFLVTDHAHLLALDRATGALVWDATMADWRLNYGSTSAPLVVGDLVVSGVSGGDEGVRGFLAAYDQATGKEVWRFWTVPKRGEPGAETWGKGLDNACAATWFTGTYDAALGTLYWPTGNPCPDYNGDERPGDNLYSDSILALDAKTGRLRWHYQYTPHDVWDWDAAQPPVLVDTEWEGQPRRLLLHANRNGFFYVLDRTDGRLLRATPFVKRLTWAREIGPDGRPVKIPGQEPNEKGLTVCPAVEGATNWFSTAFHPDTGLYYVQTLEKCTLYKKAEQKWEAGKSYFGGSTSRAPVEPGQKILRALDLRTGRAVWERPQTGPADSWGGVLATAGGLVFYGEDGGAFAAADARSGALLWRFPTHEVWKASPMTYSFDGRQYVAVASGPNILVFGLLD